jgi:ribosomal protein S18 acetylase RimI-like enzyme
MAVLPSHRRRGIGRALITAAIELARSESRSTLVVATAAADVGNLRFYQRMGFRMRSIERDAFSAATGYDLQPSIDGIELRDRVWLDLALDAPAPAGPGSPQLVNDPAVPRQPVAGDGEDAAHGQIAAQEA